MGARIAKVWPVLPSLTGPIRTATAVIPWFPSAFPRMSYISMLGLQTSAYGLRFARFSNYSGEIEKSRKIDRNKKGRDLICPGEARTKPEFDAAVRAALPHVADPTRICS